MQNALSFIFRSILELYIMTFVLRLIMQWVRADFRNPLSQFILRVTNPLVIPLRRLVPPLGKLDTATLVAAFALQLLAAVVLVNMACIGAPGILQWLAIAAIWLLGLVLQIYFFVVLVHVILSWVAPGTYNPAAMLLHTLAEPVLAPVRRVIPPIGGLDLSPVFVLIGIQALKMLLPAGQVMGGLVCGAIGVPL